MTISKMMLERALKSPVLKFLFSSSRPRSWVAWKRIRGGPRATTTCSSHRFIDTPDLHSAAPSTTILGGILAMKMANVEWALEACPC